MDAVIIGCVGLKHDGRMPARSLYRSELFRRRRHYAESSGLPWWILSAKYGLVLPDEEIETYDIRMNDRTTQERREIALAAREALTAALGDLRGLLIELHAGSAYFDAVSPVFQAAGVDLLRPLKGLGIGQQLAWYAQKPALDRRR